MFHSQNKAIQERKKSKFCFFSNYSFKAQNLFFCHFWFSHKKDTDGNMCCKVKRISVAYCQRMGRTFCYKTVFLCCMQEVFFTLQPHEGPNQHGLLNVTFVKETENKFPNSYLEMRKHQQLCDKTGAQTPQESTSFLACC